jgi:hypothetical protein
MLQKSVFNKIDRGLKTDKMNRSNLKSMAKRSIGKFGALLLKRQDHEMDLFKAFEICPVLTRMQMVIQKFVLCYRRIIIFVATTSKFRL